MPSSKKNATPAKKAGKKPAEAFNFRESYQELEEIVDWFERDDIDLDDSLVKFERGLALAQACQEKLQEVENKVRKIKSQYE